MISVLHHVFGFRLEALCIAGAVVIAPGRARAEAPVCTDLSVTWQTACCVTASGTACANLRSKGIVEALGTVTPRERPVRKMAVVGYSVCVLNEDRSVVCAPRSSNPWRAPGVEATDLAASTGAPTYGTAFCVNAIGKPLCIWITNDTVQPPAIALPTPLVSQRCP